MEENPSETLERVERLIFVLRGQRVMLDRDLAVLYGVETKALNRAVQRNIDRFPGDFMFQLSPEEAERLKSQIVTSNFTEPVITARNHDELLKYQLGTSNVGRGGRRYLPYAFTEQGVAMLSSVLRSPHAVQVNIEIVRAFVKLRRLLSENAELSRKLAALERKYDAQFRVVFDAIRELMEPPEKPKRKIGV